MKAYGIYLPKAKKYLNQHKTLRWDFAVDEIQVFEKKFIDLVKTKEVLVFSNEDIVMVKDLEYHVYDGLVGKFQDNTPDNKFNFPNNSNN